MCCINAENALCKRHFKLVLKMGRTPSNGHLVSQSMEGQSVVTQLPSLVVAH